MVWSQCEVSVFGANLVGSRCEVSGNRSTRYSIPELHASPLLTLPFSLHTHLPPTAGPGLCVVRTLLLLSHSFQQSQSGWWPVFLVAWVFADEIYVSFPGKSVVRMLLWFGRSVVSDSLQPHALKHTRLPCPSPTPGACSHSRLSIRWCHPTISSSISPLLLPSVFPSIRVFSDESALHIRWPKYWIWCCIHTATYKMTRNIIYLIALHHIKVFPFKNSGCHRHTELTSGSQWGEGKEEGQHRGWAQTIMYQISYKNMLYSMFNYYKWSTTFKNCDSLFVHL